MRTVACATVRRTPVWGTKSDQRAMVAAAAGASAATLVYVIAIRRWAPDLSPTRLEIFGTATSLMSVWLTRSQNIWAIITGITSVVTMGAFFFQIDLVGQGWLHLGYYIPVQFVGWWVWLRGGDHRSDLPVGWLQARHRLALLLGLGAITLAAATAFRAHHGESPYLLWDASIVAASIAAQLLLTAKRIESWWLWLVPVDVSAIALYLRTGAHMFAALYTLYLVLASLGLRDWVRSWRAQEAGLSALEARLATSGRASVT